MPPSGVRDLGHGGVDGGSVGDVARTISRRRSSPADGTVEDRHLGRRWSRAAVRSPAPMPLAPPVTRATSPSKSLMCVPPSGQVVGRRGSWARARRRPAASRASTSADLVEADGRGDQRPRVDGAGRVGLDGGVEARGAAEDADGGDVLEREGAGVDRAGRAGQADVDDPAGRLDQVERERRAAARGVGRVDDGVEGQVGQRRRRPHACANPSDRAKREGPAVGPSGAPRRRRPGRTARPAGRSCPGPAPAPGRPADGPRPRTARRALPPGSTSAPAVSSTASGSARSAVAGTASCSASAPGDPPRMPISYRSAQTCCRPRPAAAAGAAAEHRVAGDPAAEPRGVDAGTDRRRPCRTTRGPAASGSAACPWCR